MASASAAKDPPPTAEGTALDPTPGAYWQVMAVRRRDAEASVRTLKDLGLPAVTGPCPVKTLTRVLVGPYEDRQALSSAKTRLEAAGLHPIRTNIK